MKVNPLSLDRIGDARRRDPDWVAGQRADPQARAVVAGDRGLRVRDGRLELVPLRELDGAPALLLGLDEHGPVFAVDEDPVREGRVPMVGAAGVRGEPPAGASGDRFSLRQAAARFSQAEGGLAAYTAALLNWHRRHRFCAACGHESDVIDGGLTRLCPRCGAEHHPRTDPVVIMLVTDGSERLLLGRQAAWPTGRYSALAGFVEPGETLEAAVAREVREEAGVVVGPPRYAASQPWPFPASLMLGFSAPHVSGEPRRLDDELQDVRWFDRAEIAEAARENREDWSGPGTPDGPLGLPPKLAIARRLIDAWLLR